MKVQAPRQHLDHSRGRWHGLPREKHCRCRDKMHGVICCISAVELPSPEASRILPARMKSPWRRQLLSPSRPHVCADRSCLLAMTDMDFCAPNIVAISVLAPRMEEAVRSVFEVFSLFNVRVSPKHRLAAPTRRPFEESDLEPRTEETRPRMGG